MRALHTPVTMAVLALLRDRPRHPYEMKALLSERHVGAVVRLRGGSLYDAIGRLARAGLIEPVETGRRGARPERTVYALTGPGSALLDRLVREYVGDLAREYPVFVAGLAHLALLPAGEAAMLLAARADRVQAELDGAATLLAQARGRGIPRVVLLETEYAQAVRRAEIAWLRDVVQDIDSGDLPWIEAALDDPVPPHGEPDAQETGPATREQRPCQTPSRPDHSGSPTA